MTKKMFLNGVLDNLRQRTAGELWEAVRNEQNKLPYPKTDEENEDFLLGYEETEKFLADKSEQEVINFVNATLGKENK